jgi:hypothetical protein
LRITRFVVAGQDRDDALLVFRTLRRIDHARLELHRRLPRQGRRPPEQWFDDTDNPFARAEEPTP